MKAATRIQLSSYLLPKIGSEDPASLATAQYCILLQFYIGDLSLGSTFPDILTSNQGTEIEGRTKSFKVGTSQQEVNKHLVWCVASAGHPSLLIDWAVILYSMWVHDDYNMIPSPLVYPQ